MSQYETFKDTYLDWIGRIPEQWETIRVKGNCYVKGRIGWQELKADEFVDEGIHCVTGTDFQNQFINWSSCYRVGLERYLTDDNIQLKEGDVLITKDGTIGKTALVKNMPEKATLNSGIFLIRPNNKNLTNEYLYWVLNSTVFEEYNNYTKTGSTILHLYQNVLVEMHFPLPTSLEQLSIANYLDHQTQKIDRLIANKKAQAEKLKELRQIEINNAVTKGLDSKAEMKDSGIDWLGKIPKHWDVKRMKNILVEKMMYGANEIAVEDNEQHPRYIRITDFGSNGELKDDTFKSLPYEIAKGYLLQEGDILFARSGATVGKTFQFRNYTGIACFAGYLIKARPNFNIITSDFLFFFTQSNGYENWKNSIFSKATIENIGADKYQLLKLGVPPTVREQNQITDYLQERTTAIDKLIKNIDTQIEKLQELRKIKIYEAVTGKIKVSAYAEATT